MAKISLRSLASFRLNRLMYLWVSSPLQRLWRTKSDYQAPRHLAMPINSYPIYFCTSTPTSIFFMGTDRIRCIYTASSDCINHGPYQPRCATLVITGVLSFSTIRNPSDFNSLNGCSIYMQKKHSAIS